MKKFKVTYYFRNNQIKEDVEYADAESLNNRIMQQLQSEGFITFVRENGSRLINVKIDEIYSFAINEIKEIE